MRPCCLDFFCNTIAQRVNNPCIWQRELRSMQQRQSNKAGTRPRDGDGEPFVVASPSAAVRRHRVISTCKPTRLWFQCSNRCHNMPSTGLENPGEDSSSSSSIGILCIQVSWIKLTIWKSRSLLVLDLSDGGVDACSQPNFL